MRKLAYWSALAFLAIANGTVLSLGDGFFTSLIRVFALPAILFWASTLMVERKFRTPNVFYCLFLLFFAWNALSLLWSIDISSTLDRLQHYLDYALALGVFWSAFRDEKEVEGAMQAFVVGSYITVLGTVISYLHGDMSNSDSTRASAFAFDPNDLGFIVVLAVPIAWYLGHSSKHLPKFWGVVNFAYPFAALVTILLTASRGALLAAVPAVIYMAMSLRRYPIKWRIAIGVAAFLAVVALSQLDLSKQMDRLSTLGQSLSGGSGGDQLDGRLQIWEAGWDVFTKNAILGVGSGGFSIATLDYGLPQAEGGGVGIFAHNSYLSVLTETGILGFLMFLAIMMTVVLSIRRCKPSIRSAMYAAFAVWLLGAGNLSFECRWQTWLTFMLILAASHSVPSRIAQGIDPRNASREAASRTRQALFPGQA